MRLRGGQRSSRAIELYCRRDVAYRVISVSEHATIARFICRHERALGELFGEVPGLCDRAGSRGADLRSRRLSPP